MEEYIVLGPVREHVARKNLEDAKQRLRELPKNERTGNIKRGKLERTFIKRFIDLLREG